MGSAGEIDAEIKNLAKDVKGYAKDQEIAVRDNYFDGYFDGYLRALKYVRKYILPYWIAEEKK